MVTRTWMLTHRLELCVNILLREIDPLSWRHLLSVFVRVLREYQPQVLENAMKVSDELGAVIDRSVTVTDLGNHSFTAFICSWSCTEPSSRSSFVLPLFVHFLEEFILPFLLRIDIPTEHQHDCRYPIYCPSFYCFVYIASHSASEERS